MSRYQAEQAPRRRPRPGRRGRGSRRRRPRPAARPARRAARPRAPSAPTRRSTSAATNALEALGDLARPVRRRRTGRGGGRGPTPSSESMLGPTTRAVENRGSSTVNVVRVAQHLDGRGATGDEVAADGRHGQRPGRCARSRARCGCGSPARSSTVGATSTCQRVTADDAGPYVLRSVVLSTLPVALRGSSSTNSTRVGHLKWASRSRAKAISSAGVDGTVEGDGGDDGLAPALVGQPEDGDLAHRRVAHEDLLDLDRVDVLAAGDDHVLLAVDERDVAVVVDLAEVAGVEPAAAERVGRRRRQHPVAGEDVLAAHEQLADLADGDVAVVVVDEAGLDVQQRAADRAELLLDVVGVEHGHRRRRLGQAEALLERHAAVVEELDQRQRRRRAARQGHVERRQVVVVEARAAASAPPTSPARGTAASPGARPSRRGSAGGSNVGTMTFLAPT